MVSRRVFIVDGRVPRLLDLRVLRDHRLLSVFSGQVRSTGRSFADARPQQRHRLFQVTNYEIHLPY